MCCLHFGPVSKTNSLFFALFGGNKEDLRGTKNAKFAPGFGAHFFFFGGGGGGAWAIFALK